MVIVGSSCLQGNDNAALHAAVVSLAQSLRTSSGCGADWRVFNVLHRVIIIRLLFCL